MDESSKEITNSNNSKTALAPSHVGKGLALIGRGFDWFLAGLAILGLLTSLGSTLFEVLARYVFSSPVTWSEELSRFAFIWLTFIAAAVAIRKGEMMVSVDSLISLAPRWAQKGANLLSSGLVALVAVILVVFGWRVCKGITSRSLAMGWPVKLFYAAPLVGGIFILINLVRAPADRHARMGEFAVVVGASILCWVLFIADLVPPPDWDVAIVVNVVIAIRDLRGRPCGLQHRFWSGPRLLARRQHSFDCAPTPVGQWRGLLFAPGHSFFPAGRTVHERGRYYPTARCLSLRARRSPDGWTGPCKHPVQLLNGWAIRFVCGRLRCPDKGPGPGDG